jgi:hypothetical protein
MSERVIDALHDVHTANNDVLKGYREMSERAKPDIKGIVSRLIEMHQRHASEVSSELIRMRESTKDDRSLQGTLNKAVVMVRDWVSDLDRDVLPSIRQGEEALRDQYYKALRDVEAGADPMASRLLTGQVEAISAAIAALPKA